MCNFFNSNDNSWWWIIILIFLFCGVGGCSNGCSNGCGCNDCDRC